LLYLPLLAIITYSNATRYDTRTLQRARRLRTRAGRTDRAGSQ